MINYLQEIYTNVAEFYKELDRKIKHDAITKVYKTIKKRPIEFIVIVLALALPMIHIINTKYVLINTAACIVSLIIVLILLYIIAKNDLKEELELKISMEILTQKVFPNEVPNTEQIIFLSEIISNDFKTRQVHRNILIAAILLLMNIPTPLFLKLFKQKQSVFELLTAVTIIITSIMYLYLSSRSNSKLAQPNLWFIKNHKEIRRTLNLLQYLIYQSKKHDE